MLTAFDYHKRSDSTALRLLKRVAVAAVCLWAIVAGLSGYRAFVQVYSVRILLPPKPLRSGSRVEAEVVTSGRTFVTVQLFLEQGTRRRLLTEQEVPKNEDAASDPRPQHANVSVLLTATDLNLFAADPAVLRAVAVGRPQWMRVPPPTVATTLVVLDPN